MADPNAEPLSELLVRLRKRRLLSREALARASGIGYGTIRDLERGISRAPHMSTIRKLADTLGLEGRERAGFEAAALSGGRPRAQEREDGPIRDEASAADTSGAGAADTGFADTVAASLLPHDIGSFTGRQDELRGLISGARTEVANSAAHPRSGTRIFVIEGMGGVGKTTLAVHAAHLMADEFPDGQLFLDLQGYATDLPALTAHQALRSMLRALGVPNELIPPGRAEREAFYRNTVAGKRMLLIYDNASSAAQVRPLIPGTGGSLVIVTSRTSLRSLAASRKRQDVTIGLSAALSDYLRAHGPWPRALALHSAALQSATEIGDLHGQANALRGIGGVLSRTGEIGRSKEMLTKSVDIYRQLGDRRGAARALIELGIARRVSGDAECLATFTEALASYQELETCTARPPR